jgi:hypothetical protein
MLMLSILLPISAYAAEPLKVAIIPYVNSTAEHRPFASDTINKKYSARFQEAKYSLIPTQQVAEALAKTGYDPKMLELPDKETLTSVAKATNADVVIAMELVSISNRRSTGLFSTSAKSEVKLKFRTYETASGKYGGFQALGLGVNKAVLIGMGGMAGSIVEGIEKAMDEGFNNFSF